MRVGWVLFVTGCASRYDRILALEGDPVTGQILYEADCAACHGADGQGASGTALTETLPGLTGTQILTVIDEGAGNMPAYRGDYTLQEMADLLEYMTLEFQ